MWKTYLDLIIIIIINNNNNNNNNKKKKKKKKNDHRNKWCMHDLELVLEKETHKILWDFEIRMDHLISVKWPDLIIGNKKKKKKKGELA